MHYQKSTERVIEISSVKNIDVFKTHKKHLEARKISKVSRLHELKS